MLCEKCNGVKRDVIKSPPPKIIITIMSYEVSLYERKISCYKNILTKKLDVFLARFTVRIASLNQIVKTSSVGGKKM
jgi:hypothetical protein